MVGSRFPARPPVPTHRGPVIMDPAQPANPAGPNLLQDLWTHTFPAKGEPELYVLFGRLVMAFALGLVIAGVYRWTAPAKGRTPSFVPTLVLLCILIAMVTQVVGESIAKAFSLVGS